MFGELTGFFSPTCASYWEMNFLMRPCLEKWYSKDYFKKIPDYLEAAFLINGIKTKVGKSNAKRLKRITSFKVVFDESINFVLHYFLDNRNRQDQWGIW